MTKKHFEVIANIIAATDLSDKSRKAITNAFINVLPYYNERFDPVRFEKACHNVSK